MAVIFALEVLGHVPVSWRAVGFGRSWNFAGLFASNNVLMFLDCSRGLDRMPGN
jgi:hypothetical protein